MHRRYNGVDVWCRTTVGWVGCLSRLKFRAWILFWTSDLQCVVCQHYGDFSKGFIYTNAEPTINSSPLRHLFSIQGTTRSESPCSASKFIEISKGLAKLCGTQVGNHWRLWGLTQMLEYSHTHSCPTTLSGVRVPMPTVHKNCFFVRRLLVSVMSWSTVIMHQSM